MKISAEDLRILLYHHRRLLLLRRLGMWRHLRHRTARPLTGGIRGPTIFPGSTGREASEALLRRDGHPAGRRWTGGSPTGSARNTERTPATDRRLHLHLR